MSKPRGILDRRPRTTIVTREKRVEEEAIEDTETEARTEAETEGETGNRDGKRYNIPATRPHCTIVTIPCIYPICKAPCYSQFATWMLRQEISDSVLQSVKPADYKVNFSPQQYSKRSITIAVRAINIAVA